MKESNIVTDYASAEECHKGFLVSEVMSQCGMGYSDLAKKGFTCDSASMKYILDSDPELKKHIEQIAKDAGLSIGEANIDALGQFFTLFNEQTINVLYRGRTMAQTFGVKTMGDWTTERIVFKTRELTANNQLYDDFTRAPYASYNYTYDTRDTLRMEWGLEVTKLEEAVGAVMRRSPDKDKKEAIVLNQNIWLNEFFLSGASIGNKRLYGVTTEPNISSAARKRNLPFDFTSETLTVDNVVSALRMIKQRIVEDLQGNGDIETLPIEIACPICFQTAFTIQNSVTGYTANKWLAENWKAATVSFKPEFDTADDGEPMMMVFAKSVPDVGMDTINLIQTSKLHLVGAMPSIKGRSESYSCSVAGAICACPFGVSVWANGVSASS